MLSVLLLNIAALRFQPTRRPQIASQKAKPKATAARSAIPAASAPAQTPGAVPEAPANVVRSVPKSTLADWTGDGEDDDVNGFYGEKRQRGGRKKRKKNKEEAHAHQDWDAIYDPSRPNNYEEYKTSEEKIREVREWKDRLYAHRMARHHSDTSDSEDDRRSRPHMNSKSVPWHLTRTYLKACRTLRTPSDVLRSSSTRSRRHPATTSASRYTGRCDWRGGLRKANENVWLVAARTTAPSATRVP